MKTINVRINGENHSFEIEPNHYNYLEITDKLKDITDYPNNHVSTISQFVFVLIPTIDTEFNNWYDVLYKNIMSMCGYSNNSILNIMGNINTRPMKPNSNFTRSHTAAGLITRDIERRTWL